jgi:hypothetical protein
LVASADRHQRREDMHARFFDALISMTAGIRAGRDRPSLLANARLATAGHRKESLLQIWHIHHEKTQKSARRRTVDCEKPPALLSCRPNSFATARTS